MVKAQLWCAPAAIPFTPLFSPTTSAGVSRSTVFPSPNCPSSLSPQHFTPPLVVRAQVWAPTNASNSRTDPTPAAISVTPFISPSTFTGAVELTSRPFPNCPWLLSPQHWTPPVSLRIQVWCPPASIICTPVASPTTFTGVGRSIVVPSPNCPELLFPQHFTSPVSVMAQVWCPPVAIALTPCASPATSTGILRSRVLPSPTWPASLLPQHLSPPVSVNAQV